MADSLKDVEKLGAADALTDSQTPSSSSQISKGRESSDEEPQKEVRTITGFKVCIQLQLNYPHYHGDGRF